MRCCYNMVNVLLKLIFQSLHVRAECRVSLVSSKQSFTSVTTMEYSICCHTGPCYNDLTTQEGRIYTYFQYENN